MVSVSTDVVKLSAIDTYVREQENKLGIILTVLFFVFKILEGRLNINCWCYNDQTLIIKLNQTHHIYADRVGRRITEKKSILFFNAIY